MLYANVSSSSPRQKKALNNFNGKNCKHIYILKKLIRHKIQRWIFLVAYIGKEIVSEELLEIQVRKDTGLWWKV